MQEFNKFFADCISIKNYSRLVNKLGKNCLKFANLFSFQNELQNY